MININDTISLNNGTIDISCIGELLIDMISTDYAENGDLKTFEKHFGGSPANIAINTKRLGLNSALVASVGNDFLGDFIIDVLKKADINTQYISRVEHSTSMVVVTKSKATPIPIFYRAADFQIKSSNELVKLITNSKILHFSCWPISRKPARMVIEETIKIAKENNTLVCFDPNYHPMIWEKDHNSIEYIKWILGNVDIVKPSEDDAKRIFGEDEPQRQVEKFLKYGAKLVIMTLGKDGIIASNGIETIKMDAIKTEVIDTTGAGDAFWSGLYAGIINGYTLKESIKMGLKTSAIKLKTVGAALNNISFADIIS